MSGVTAAPAGAVAFAAAGADTPPRSPPMDKARRRPRPPLVSATASPWPCRAAYSTGRR